MDLNHLGKKAGLFITQFNHLLSTMAQQGQPQQVAPAAPAPQLPHVPRVGKAFNVLVIRDYLRKVQASAPNVPQDDSSYAGRMLVSWFAVRSAGLDGVQGDILASDGESTP